MAATLPEWGRGVERGGVMGLGKVLLSMHASRGQDVVKDEGWWGLAIERMASTRLLGGMLLAMGDDMAFNLGYIQSVLHLCKLSCPAWALSVLESSRVAGVARLGEWEG